MQANWYSNCGVRYPFSNSCGRYCFLDEIGDLPPRLSAKVSALLPERRFQRVGGRQEPESDARGIAAKDSALKTGIAKGIFRKGFMLGGLNSSPAATRLKEARGNLEREMV